MDIEKIEELENKLFEAESNIKISLYIIVIGVVGFIGNIIGWFHDTQIMLGAILGGGFVFWGVNFDKKQKTIKKLDDACFLKYKKSYNDSISEIVNERYKNRKYHN